MLYEKEKKEIEKEILKNLSHINQIDEIKSIFLKFKKILENFDIDKSKELPYEIQKIQIYVLSNGGKNSVRFYVLLGGYILINFEETFTVCAIAPSHLNLYSFLLIITVVYGLLFESLFIIITPFPSFFFKKYCLLV